MQLAAGKKNLSTGRYACIRILWNKNLMPASFFVERHTLDYKTLIVTRIQLTERSRHSWRQQCDVCSSCQEKLVTPQFNLKWILQTFKFKIKLTQVYRHVWRQGSAIFDLSTSFFSSTSKTSYSRGRVVLGQERCLLPWTKRRIFSWLRFSSRVWRWYYSRSLSRSRKQRSKAEKSPMFPGVSFATSDII